jgi:hypothetical protein
LALQAEKGIMQCTSPLHAWNIIKRELEGADLVQACPGCGSKATLVTRFKETFNVIIGKFISHLTRYFSCLIQIRITAECINSTFWFTRFFGMDDPLRKPPQRDRSAQEGEENLAYLPGFDRSLEDQEIRYDMTRISALHYRSQFLSSTLFILFGRATTSYNTIMSMYSTRFNVLIRENWNYDGVTPELPRSLSCYYKLSGAIVFLTYTTAIEARLTAIKRLQPVIDDLFRQLQTTSVYNKGPLYANSLDLKPSPEAVRQIEHRLKAKADKIRAAHRGLNSQTNVVSSQSTQQYTDLPPELAAVYGGTSSSQHEGTKESVLTPTTPNPRTGTTSTSGRSESTVGNGNLYVYNPLPNNMSFVLPANPLITTGNKPIGEQFLVIHEGDGGTLGTGTPTVDVPQPSGEHTTRVSQTGRRPPPPRRSPHSLRTTTTPVTRIRTPRGGDGIRNEGNGMRTICLAPTTKHM